MISHFESLYAVPNELTLFCIFRTSGPARPLRYWSQSSAAVSASRIRSGRNYWTWLVIGVHCYFASKFSPTEFSKSGRRKKLKFSLMWCGTLFVVVISEIFDNVKIYYKTENCQKQLKVKISNLNFSPTRPVAADSSTQSECTQSARRLSPST